VASALQALGIRGVFGIVSVHNLPVADAITQQGSIGPGTHRTGSIPPGLIVFIVS
jgi:thiamine pyrophosphate-dependent acetolactate synthase large subunit-like protein